jgi:membrane-bound lytic murein transglycosylase B
MLKIDVEAMAKVGRDAYAKAWNKTGGKSGPTVFFWNQLSPVGRAAEMAQARAALGELARQGRESNRIAQTNPDKKWVFVEELEAASKAPDTSALDEARRKLSEAEDAVRAARERVDAIERG